MLEPNFRPAPSSVLRVIKALRLLKMNEEQPETWLSGVLPPTVLLILRTEAKIFIYSLLKQEKVRIRTMKRLESTLCTHNSRSLQRYSYRVSVFINFVPRSQFICFTALVASHFVHMSTRGFTTYWPTSFQPHHGSGVYLVSNRNDYRKISGGKARPECKAVNLTAIQEPTVYRSYRPAEPVTGTVFLFRVLFIVCNVSFLVCVASCVVSSLSMVHYFVRYVYFLLRLIVVSLPSGKNLFAVQLNNN
jgi:hypothetical protein